MNTCLPSVTVIIINFNGQSDTRICLDSILRSNYTNFTISVLDNGSTHGTTETLQKEFSDPRIKWIRSEHNLGFAGGNNFVIKQSDSEYIALLNNDTEVEKEWITELVKTIQSDTNVVASQSKLRSYFNKQYFEYAGAAGGLIDMLGYPYARGRIGFHLEEDQGQYDSIIELQWATGAASLFKKAAIEEVGFLPEEFFFHHEEIDLCWRLRNKGYKILFAPLSIVYHKGSSSSKSNLPKKIFYVHRNSLLLLARNMSTRRAWITVPLRMVLDYLSCIFYLLTGKYSFILPVLKSHLSFLTFLPQIMRYRAEFAKQGNSFTKAEKGLKPESIFWNYFVLGKKRYSEIIEKKQSDIPVLYYEEFIQKNFVIKHRKTGLRIFTHPISIFMLIALLIVALWFVQKKIIASGEEGLVYANPWRIFTLYKYLWYDTGTGYPMPLMVPRAPYFAFVGMIKSVTSDWIAQAAVFYLLIITGMTGMYALAREMKVNKYPAIIASLFYFFNLYTMSQVWGRLLSNGHVAWAYLPLFILIWIKVLSTKKLKWIGAIIVSSFIFSNAFGHPAYLVTFWIPVLLYGLYLLNSERKNNVNSIKTISIGIIALLIWTATNWWWIHPFIAMGKSAFVITGNPQENYDSLRGVSQYFPTTQILLLKQTFIFSEAVFKGWYLTPQAIALSICVLIIAIIGLIGNIKKRFTLFLLLLFLSALFLSKGTNPPLGERFYENLFAFIPATQSLRNSYEKVGMILIIPYAIFFALGIEIINNQVKNKKISILLNTIILATSFGILVWPIWTGDLYGGSVSNTRVKVPEYYYEANTYLNNQKNDGRILMMPIIPGDGIAYDWDEGGYSGIDPTEHLLDRTAVSKILRMKYYDEKYLNLYKQFEENNEDEWKKQLTEMNIRYLVVRNDISGYQKNSVETIKKLQEYSQIEKRKAFGKLSIYELTTPQANHFQVLSDNPPTITYNKIDPTNYLVSVKNATEKFNLVFKETFNDAWIASIDGQQVKSHTVKYNYANYWEINKIGSYTISIQFKL
ncbi:MAG: alpha-(1-_3)-arabinofuranosyltransferase family protein [bacterium]|nr:alpha-(1->3)-arabinofuranosyltransferase family protein [bacterium]